MPSQTENARGCCRLIPLAAIVAFVITLFGLLLFTEAKDSTIDVLSRDPVFQHYVTSRFGFSDALVGLIVVADVFALILAFLSSDAARERIYRTAGCFRAFSRWCCMPGVLACVWLTIIASLVLSYFSLSATIVLRSSQIICSSGATSRNAAQKLSDAIVASVNSDIPPPDNSTVAQYCTDVDLLDDSPKQLFAGTVILFFGQMFLRSSLELYSTRNHIEACVTDSMYGQGSQPLNAVRTKSELELADRRG